ncbi:MAG: archaetidylserine decarboxylase [Candidatus Obscuribacterales bacterium]|nr:archaetidylserine decarboxylase [Candidatus Obscuribacterales bacterium]
MMQPPPIYRLVKALPRTLLSRLVGWLVRFRLPAVMTRQVLRTFVHMARIDMKEAELPLSAYGTIEEVFARRLKPGMRTIVGEVSAPSDGVLTLSEPVNQGTTLQVKGLTYSVNELLHGKPVQTPNSQPAHAMTVYLSPRNYHRVHAPVDGTVTEVKYFPGDLWPVNDRFIRLVPSLFVRNERMVIRIGTNGGGAVHVVMVGALNVGRMTTPLVSNFVTNATSRRKPFVVNLQRPVCRGDELGVFMLGSTVVLIFDEVAAERFKFSARDDGDNKLPRTLKMGEQIACSRPALKPV